MSAATQADTRPDARPLSARVDVLVTADAIAAYRSVVLGRAMVPGPGCGGGPTASPVHPFVLVWPAFQKIVELLAAEAEPGAEPPAPVHLSQEITQERPLCAGEQVAIEARVIGARRDPRGVRLAVESVLSDTAGTPFAELLTSVLLIGATGPEPFGEVPSHPSPGGGSTPTVVTRDVPLDLPRRYAEVSGDDNPIHVDRAAAQAAGFPDVIAHGMSIVALVSEEIIARFGAGDANRVRSLGGRFSSPVVPGETLEISLVPDGEGRYVRFTCKTPRGIAVKNGWVELAHDRGGRAEGE